jgi:hypothetical protein
LGEKGCAEKAFAVVGSLAVDGPVASTGGGFFIENETAE